MKCEICGQREGVPTIYIVNNTKTTRYICKECTAKKMAEREAQLKKQLQVSLGQFFGQSIFGHEVLPLNNIFAPVVSVQPLKCAKCGTTIEDFRRTSLVGCAECYEAFAKPMEQVLANCQPKTTHVGKAPNGYKNINAEYDNLRQQLEKAVFEERYSDAALIKQKMDKLKN